MHKHIRNALIKKYKNLPDLDRQVMHLKALCYKLRTKTEFLTCIQKSTLRTADGKRFYSQQLNPTLQKLRELGLLDDSWNCHKFILHYITRQALLIDNSKAYLQAIAILPTYHNRLVLDDDITSNFTQLRIVHIAVHTNTTSTLMDFTQNDASQWFYLICLFIKLFNHEKINFKWLATKAPLIQEVLCLSKLYGYYNQSNVIPIDLPVWLTIIKTKHGHFLHQLLNILAGKSIFSWVI